jgi:hypothetical protein
MSGCELLLVLRHTRACTTLCAPATPSQQFHRRGTATPPGTMMRLDAEPKTNHTSVASGAGSDSYATPHALVVTLQYRLAVATAALAQRLANEQHWHQPV